MRHDRCQNTSGSDSESAKHSSVDRGKPNAYKTAWETHKVSGTKGHSLNGDCTDRG